MSPARPRSPQSAVRSPQSAVRSPQSAVRAKVIAVLVGATIATGACTTNLTDSIEPESARLSTAPNSSPAAAVLDDIGSFLIAAGCTRTTASDTGLIVLGFTSAAGERFDCAGVDPVARRAAYRSEVLANAARQALESGMALALSGYYEWNVIDVQSVCTVYWGSHSITFPNSGEVDAFSPVDGVYVGTYYVEGGVPLRLDFYQDTPCTETMVSRGTFVPFDGGDGSGGDGGCCAGGPGGDDGGPSSPPPPPTSCPSSDPACWKPLTTTQITLLKSVIAVEFADSNLTTDAIARQDCREARQRLDAAMLTVGGGDPKIWAGGSDVDGGDGDVNKHHGQTDAEGTRFHIDPVTLDSASGATDTRTRWRRALLALALHEASHLDPWLYLHPNADSAIARGSRPTTPAQIAKHYLLDRPFAVIHTQLAGAQCVKPI